MPARHGRAPRTMGNLESDGLRSALSVRLRRGALANGGVAVAEPVNVSHAPRREPRARLTQARLGIDDSGRLRGPLR
jgi:hypothetical protein